MVHWCLDFAFQELSPSPHPGQTASQLEINDPYLPAGLEQELEDGKGGTN